ncbi:DNA primase [Neolewinella maritima]|uniref:DNA primase n=1 Tax=Neolewinella maritima TaxID=1383882 RepID=A0ABM9B0P6_9BACT|nr:DNA primase [Neolewinella maritima]CAH1000199.1 DNA primase [Neolewinella maritima]
MITEDSVREVIDSARIEDVVGDFVNLRRRGNNYSGLCPFHNEKTPSFNVNPARNIYKCFGCGVGGDPVKFLMELEQLTFPDAIRWIAGKYNIQLEEKEVSPEFREELQERESLIITNDFARAYYQEQLTQSEEGKSIGLSYFKQRGFRKETLETFGLGYAPMQRDGLLKAATAAGYKEEQLEKLGLVRNGRDFFFDRVMFTIHNVAGKPIAFAGRILKKNVKAPKYINSPETEVYHKSDVLYGMYQARQTVRKLDLVYMVEGYTDVISLHQNGIKNVVATSGTSLTSGQAQLVKRFTENVTLLYDGDKAGIKAALRGVDVLLTNDLNVRVVVLPDGHDPDSYLQEVGTTAFETHLQTTAQDFLFFKADLLLEEAKDDVGQRTEAIRDIGSTLALVTDPLKRAGYLQQFSARLGLEESLLVNLVNKAIGDRRKEQRKDQEREARRARRAGGSQTSKPTADRTSGEDGWAGLEEPAWYGGEADSPEVASTPTAARAADDVQEQPAAIPVGHAFQERHLVELLIRHGHQVYDEETGSSVAAYLTGNVADLLGDFDDSTYRDMVVAVTERVRSTSKAPEPTWYASQPDQALRQLAVDAAVSPYTYSPNWKKVYGLHLSQKLPEDNHRLAAETFLYIFRMEKIERKSQQNAVTIARLEREGNLDLLRTHLKVQMKLDKLRLTLAKELGTVVLSK